MTEKTVIALMNAANRGKTQTLKHLAQLIQSKYATQMKNSKMEVIVGSEDFNFYFELNGKKVNIISRGDPRTGLLVKLNSSKECDLIICTCRTKGTTVKEVKTFCKNEQAILISSQTYEVDSALKTDKTIFDETNRLKAKHLLALIEKKQLI